MKGPSGGILTALFAFVAAVVLGLPVGGAQAQEWKALPGLTSAKLAASGWLQTSAAGLSWPDGRQAVVTFWVSTENENQMTMRCVDYFDDDMVATGGGCSQAVK